MTEVTVHGNATAEEIAAVLAVVTAHTAPPATDAFARWRQTRIAALRAAHATRRRP